MKLSRRLRLQLPSKMMPMMQTQSASSFEHNLDVEEHTMRSSSLLLVVSSLLNKLSMVLRVLAVSLYVIYSYLWSHCSTTLTRTSWRMFFPMDQSQDTYSSTTIACWRRWWKVMNFLLTLDSQYAGQTAQIIKCGMYLFCAHIFSFCTYILLPNLNIILVHIMRMLKMPHMHVPILKKKKVATIFQNTVTCWTGAHDHVLPHFLVVYHCWRLGLGFLRYNKLLELKYHVI